MPLDTGTSLEGGIGPPATRSGYLGGVEECLLVPTGFQAEYPTNALRESSDWLSAD